MRSPSLLGSALICSGILLVFSMAGEAQKGAGGGGGRGGGPGIGSPTSGAPGNLPGNTLPPGQPPQVPSQAGPSAIFLSGRAMFDDGTPANANVAIERVCSGHRYLESHTDSKGRFYFQLGSSSQTGLADASEENGSSVRGSGPALPMTASQSGGFGTGAQKLFDCDLQASYPGYRSDLISLSSRRMLDDPNIGTIILHRITAVKGTTLSATSAMAPKRAQKEYEKGMTAANKQNFDAAQTHFTKATDEYPKYAEAWLQLGLIAQNDNRTADAQKAYQAAISADGKLVPPYLQMAFLSAQQQKWDNTAHYSAEVIELNPVEFPNAFWYNAIANYNLHRLTEAEKSCRELVKLDTAHAFPLAENMMADLLVRRGQYSEAAQHLKEYLVLVPNAKNADVLKQQLLKLEQASATPPAAAVLPR
jgi:tetratricopeptide (TPR) repeat protein